MTSLSSSSFFICLLLCICISSVWSLQVTPNSPCARVCMDDPTADTSDPNVSNTNSSNIVCNDADYDNTAVGRKFKQCLTCLQNSTATSGSESDKGWFLYNLRYAFNVCLYAPTNSSNQISTPCATNSVCGPLQSSVQQGIQNPSTMGDEYSYCTANNNAFLGSNLGVCQTCLRENNDVFYLSNFLVALDAGCIQEPLNSSILGLNATLFTNTQVSIINPVTTTTTTSSHHKGLSTGAIIGIAVAGAVLILLISAFVFIRLRKRRNAQRLLKLRSPLDERFGAINITAPNKGAYSSPQISPSIHKDGIQMMQTPANRNFSFSRPTQKAGQWTGSNVRVSGQKEGTPSTVFSNQSQNSPPPPGYEHGVSPPNSGRSEGFPVHHGYIPPSSQQQNTTSLSSPNSTTPIYTPGPPPLPPQPIPATYPQRSPSMSVTSGNSNTSPRYGHRSTQSTSSTQRGPRISPGLANINSMPNSPPMNQYSPNPSPGYQGQGQGQGMDDEARRARERLYREGLAGRTLVHGREEEEHRALGHAGGHARSPDSDSGSEELWPGSY